MTRKVVLTLLVLLLSGCRITTTIVGQGTVTSQSGNFNCSTGNIGACAKDYATAGSEVFTAVPAPGWTFAKWTNCNYVNITSCVTSFGQNTAADNWPITATFKPNNPPVQSATYTYNALGQRMTKKVGGVTTIFQYDLEGNLLSELNSSGQALRQHIHIGGEPIAQVSTAPASGTIAVQYVHTDHLGTPNLLTNQGGSVVADIEATPFGETYVDYAEVDYNKRFPGQYKDAETGLHYNYFRDYDPSTGRYVQSDPIGLESGLNTYIYVQDNPINFFDPYGLFGQTVQGASSGRRGRGPGTGLAIVDAFTQLNGNFTPDFQNQDGGHCSLPGRLGTFGDSCIPKICQDHDVCFQKNYCNATSWFSWALGGTKSCNQCNEDAFQVGGPLVMDAIGF